jgi:hypothetical protein
MKTVTTTTFTPGPWHQHGEVGDIIDETDRLVARVSQLYKSGEANARLIAAAPDLLAELQRLHDRVDDMNAAITDLEMCVLCRDYSDQEPARYDGNGLIHKDDCPLVTARIAIAKATGASA